jgi:Flp pilus assembly protein TadG
MAKQFLDTLRKHLRDLRTATGANVTLTFALSTIPLVGFVGAAVDYSHANAVKTALQAAADATALTLSKTAMTLTEGQLQTKATEYFNAVFIRPDADGLLVDAKYTSTPNPMITLNASTSVKTYFMGIMGFTSLSVSTESRVKWGNTKLRVALALDTTGSMADDGKMAALKTAGKNLIDQLKAVAIKDGDVYVAIVPFSKDVNVGAANKDASWIYWDNAAKNDNTSWDALNGDCSMSVSPKNRSNCIAKGTCSNTSKTSKNSCTSAGATWTPATWTPKPHTVWNGCVTDRDQDYDTKNTAPTVDTVATLFRAEQYASCSAQLMELTYNWDTLKTKIDALNPNGNTNQGIGLVWAFQALTASPFTIPPKDPLYKYTDVIILMSDGLNTQNRFSTSQTAIDAREAITCTNAKNAGIVIFSVQVNTGGDPTQTVMKDCASKVTDLPPGEKFFELKSANQLISTFNSIGTALSNLRIAQ